MTQPQWTDFGAQAHMHPQQHVAHAQAHYATPTYNFNYASPAAYPADAAAAAHMYAQAYPSPAPTPYYSPGYAVPPYQSPVVPNNSSLVLYNPMGTLASFSTPPPSRPTANPFTPGLEPLPLVPQPKTFVSDDPRASKFPCSTKCDKNDPLAWITPALFDTDAVEAEVNQKRVALRDLRDGTVLTHDVKLEEAAQQPVLLTR